MARGIDLVITYDRRLILEGRRYSEDSVLLSRAARHIGWDAVRVTDYTYEDDGVRPVLYASKNLATIVSEACNVHFDRPAHDWLARLPERYLKRLVTYHAKAPDQWPERPMFVKCADTKWFQAKVYQPEEMLELGAQMDEDGILISEPVTFETEFRTFVLDGRVTTLSSYMAGGVPTQTPDGGPRSRSWIPTWSGSSRGSPRTRRPTAPGAS
jgi:hypothetical protein